MTVSADTFRQLLGCFATGVAVLTCRDERGAARGMTVNAIASVSLDPPLLLVCVSRYAPLLTELAHASCFGLNVLAHDQRAVSDHFAQETVVKDIPYDVSERGVPSLGGATAFIECRRHDLADGGDHVVLFGSVIGGTTTDVPPLTYYRGSYGGLTNGE